MSTPILQSVAKSRRQNLVSQFQCRFSETFMTQFCWSSMTIMRSTTNSSSSYVVYPLNESLHNYSPSVIRRDNSMVSAQKFMTSPPLSHLALSTPQTAALSTSSLLIQSRAQTTTSSTYVYSSLQTPRAGLMAELANIRQRRRKELQILAVDSLKLTPSKSGIPSDIALHHPRNTSTTGKSARTNRRRNNMSSDRDTRKNATNDDNKHRNKERDPPMGIERGRRTNREIVPHRNVTSPEAGRHPGGVADPLNSQVSQNPSPLIPRLVSPLHITEGTSCFGNRLKRLPRADLVINLFVERHKRSLRDENHAEKDRAESQDRTSERPRADRPRVVESSDEHASVEALRPVDVLAVLNRLLDIKDFSRQSQEFKIFTDVVTTLCNEYPPYPVKRIFIKFARLRSRQAILKIWPRIMQLAGSHDPAHCSAVRLNESLDTMTESQWTPSEVTNLLFAFASVSEIKIAKTDIDFLLERNVFGVVVESSVVGRTKGDKPRYVFRGGKWRPREECFSKRHKTNRKGPSKPDQKNRNRMPSIDPSFGYSQVYKLISALDKLGYDQTNLLKSLDSLLCEMLQGKERERYCNGSNGNNNSTRHSYRQYGNRNRQNDNGNGQNRMNLTTNSDGSFRFENDDTKNYDNVTAQSDGSKSLSDGRATLKIATAFFHCGLHPSNELLHYLIRHIDLHLDSFEYAELQCMEAVFNFFSITQTLPKGWNKRRTITKTIYIGDQVRKSVKKRVERARIENYGGLHRGATHVFDFLYRIEIAMRQTFNTENASAGGGLGKGFRSEGPDKDNLQQEMTGSAGLETPHGLLSDRVRAAMTSLAAKHRKNARIKT